MLAAAAPASPLERLWDGRALRTALAYGEVRGARVRALSAAAHLRIAAAAELGAELDVAALVLHRDAVVLRVAAVLAARDPHADVSELGPEAAWDALDVIASAGEGPAPPPTAVAREALSSSALASLDDLAPADRSRARAEAEALDEWLRALVESRAPTAIRAGRLLRLALFVVVVAVAAIFGGRALGVAPNVALGKPVTASSRHPGTGAPDGLVDGERTGAYGAHTNREKNPWLAVDLGSVHSIRRIVVYNRGDGYEGEVVPLVLEASTDGKRYVRLGERTEIFTQADPWRIDVEPTPARWVRVRRPQPGYIALAEIEVFE